MKRNVQHLAEFIGKTFCQFGFLSALAFGVLAHNAAEHAVAQPAAGVDSYKRVSKAYMAPDVVLTDYNDKSVNLRALLASNDPVMMNFVFTTCSTICPVTTKVMSDVPALLGREGAKLRMISISIDPENDTPLQLKAYARSFGAGDRWTFLTGGTADVKAVQLAFDNYRGDKMNHEPVTLIRQAAGKPWIRIDGFATPNELVREYRAALKQ